MANEQNLIPMDQRSENEVRELAKKGGVASGVSRRRKRDMAKAAKMLLDMPAPARVQALLEQFGVPEEDQTTQFAILGAMAMKAFSGDARAAEFLRDTAGYNPKVRLEEKRFKAEQESGNGGTDIVSDWIDSIPDAPSKGGGEDADQIEDQEGEPEEGEAP